MAEKPGFLLSFLSLSLSLPVDTLALTKQCMPLESKALTERVVSRRDRETAIAFLSVRGTGRQPLPSCQSDREPDL